jgi:hypothetical protein
MLFAWTLSSGTSWATTDMEAAKALYTGVVGGTQAAESYPLGRLRRRQHLLWQRTAVLAGYEGNDALASSFQ